MVEIVRRVLSLSPMSPRERRGLLHDLAREARGEGSPDGQALAVELETMASDLESGTP